MAYTDSTALKAYLGISGTGDDALLSSCVTRAQAIVDAQFSATFEAETETRYYTQYDIENSNVLWLDMPLLTVTTLTNGDGDTISADDYWLLPRNDAPYWYIKLKSGGTTTAYEFNTDGEVSVAGTWGYTATAPGEIVQATLRLAGYIYRQKDSQIFDTTAILELGTMTIPGGIPKDVERLLSIVRSRYALA